MHPRIQELLQYLDETAAELRAAVDSVPADLREVRPAAGRWSVAEVIEHLSIVEQRTAQMAATQIAAGQARGLSHDAGQNSVLQTFDAAAVVDRSRPIVASEAAQPTGSLDAAAAWSALTSAREAVRQSVLGGDGLALSELVVPHSVLGHLNLYHWIAFIGAHELRHAEQIREIGKGIR
jgi:hypothetical protein